MTTTAVAVDAEATIAYRASCPVTKAREPVGTRPISVKTLTLRDQAFHTKIAILQTTRADVAG